MVFQRDGILVRTPEKDQYLPRDIAGHRDCNLSSTYYRGIR